MVLMTLYNTLYYFLMVIMDGMVRYLEQLKIKMKLKIKKRQRVTIREFVVHRIQIRELNKERSVLHLSGRLFQQYLVDQFAKWESNNLRWYQNNRQHFRTEIYSGLQDNISDDMNINQIGKRII